MFKSNFVNPHYFEISLSLFEIKSLKKFIKIEFFSSILSSMIK